VILKHSYLLCAVLLACAPEAHRAAPTVVLPPAGGAQPAARSTHDELLSQLGGRIDELTRAAGRADRNDEALAMLAALVHSLGFPKTAGVLNPPNFHRVVAAQMYPVNLDRDEAPEYVITLEARYENPNAGSGDSEPSGYLYVAWLDEGPGGFRIVGRHAIEAVENAVFSVRFEPVHDTAFADTIVETSWSHTVNVASSGADGTTPTACWGTRSARTLKSTSSAILSLHVRPGLDPGSRDDRSFSGAKRPSCRAPRPRS
jgi:hypothetical protein